MMNILRKLSGAACIAAIMCIIISACATGEETGGGAATAVNGGVNRYKSIRLTPEIYNHSNGDLSDLRVKDSQGKFTPFFINSGNLLEYESDREESPMELINAYTKDYSFYFDYKVVSVPNRTVLATSIETATNSSGFAKNIEVFGSYDDRYWEFIQNDDLYSIGGVSKLNVDFIEPQKYTHYRFKLGNNLERIKFESVTLVFKSYSQEYAYFIESMAPEFSVMEEEKQTVVHLNGLLNLRLAEITIHTDSMFKRYVTDPNGRDEELYNLNFENASYADTSISYFGQINSYIDFTLRINNGDDAPVEIKGITVKYYADDLVFEDKGGDRYTLSFGRNEAAKAPEYDIAKYKIEILKGEVDRLGLSVESLPDPDKSPSQVDYKLIFNIVIIAVAVLLGALVLLKLRKTPK